MQRLLTFFDRVVAHQSFTTGNLSKIDHQNYIVSSKWESERPAWRIQSHIFPIKVWINGVTSFHLLALGNFQFSQLVNLSSFHLVNLSNCPFVNLSFCQLVLLSTCPFVNLSFCQLVLLSTCPFVNLSFGQIVLLSTCPFVNLSF